MSANNLSVFGCDIDLIMGCGSSIGLVEIRWITIKHARTTTTVIMTMAPPKPLFRLNFLAREASFGSLVDVEALGGVESGLRLVEPAPRSPEEATIVATLQTVVYNHTMSSMEDIQLCAVFNDGDDIGFVYSCNNGLGRPEFIARNVPRSNGRHTTLCRVQQWR